MDAESTTIRIEYALANGTETPDCLVNYNLLCTHKASSSSLYAPYWCIGLGVNAQADRIATWGKFDAELKAKFCCAVDTDRYRCRSITMMGGGSSRKWLDNG